MATKAVIEIQTGSNYKYEVNKEGIFVLDKVTTLAYPANYGFIVNSKRQSDGDNLDIFIISSVPITQLAICKVNVVGAFMCLDKGEADNKVVAYLDGDSLDSEMLKYYHYDLIHIFLKTYKQDFQVVDFLEKTHAINLVKENTI